MSDIHNSKKSITCDVNVIRNDVKDYEAKESIVLSLGENCLADDILARNNLKSFSSPYAS